MDSYIETGPFNKPDPTTKSALFAEDQDTINKLTRERDKARSQNKYMAFAVVASVLVAGFGISKAETKYYMVERTPDGRDIIYVPDRVEIPSAEVIKAELADFVRNSRAIYTDNRANLEMRWDALKMVQMADGEREDSFNQAEESLKDLHENVSVMVTDIIPTNRGGEHWSLEWKETYRDRRTGRQQSKMQVADIEAFYVEQDGKNPGGVLFSKPIESIYSEQVK